MSLDARTSVVPLLMALGLVAVEAASARALTADGLWERSVRNGREVAHTGEVLSVTYEPGAEHATTVEVASDGDGLTVRSPGGRDVSLPALAPSWSGDLGDKYRLVITGPDRLLDRPVTRLEVRRRAGDVLRERLWVDDATGLVLRRERYDGDRLLAMAAYQRLRLEPDPQPARARPAVRTTALAVPAVFGWPLPERLPGGYRAIGQPVLAGDAVRLSYDDGLYRVSVYAQEGRPDWDALPPGATPVEGLPYRAYTWPGAAPQRLLWEASGVTWTVIGESPPDELAAIVEALPRPPAAGPLTRLGKGLARLWSLLVPWS